MANTELAEHAPAPQPLIANWYAALGFSDPAAEYDPSTGMYTASVPADRETHLAECGADPVDCARWLAELGDDVTLEAS